MLRVYIASPYTKGDPAVNINVQIKAAHKLMDLGCAPFVPLPGNHILNLAQPRPYEDWLGLDLEWLPQCQAVLRLPGESAGADKECELARSLGIPVLEGWGNFVEWYQGLGDNKENK